MTDANPGEKMYKMSLKHLLHQKVRKQRLLSLQQKDSGANVNRFPHQPKIGIWGVSKDNNCSLMGIV